MPATDDIPADNTALGWALYYYELGLSIVPIAPGTKWPGLEPGKPMRWKPYQAERPDKVQLARWFGDPRHRDCGLGLITGEISGRIFAIDVDVGPGKTGAEDWDALQLRHGDVVTWRARSGGGGNHWFFRAPEGLRTKSAKGVIGPHVDVRGDGGFLVLPPTVHPNGRRYEWLDGWHPDECDLADAPDWLLAYVRDDGSSSPASVVVNLPSRSEPAHDRRTRPTDVWGRTVDGREEAMRDAVWEALVRAWIERDGTPFEPEELAEFEQDLWAEFSASIVPRPEDRPEERGFPALRRRVRYALRHWGKGGRIDQAAQEPRHDDGGRPMPEPTLPGGAKASAARTSRHADPRDNLQEDLRNIPVSELLALPPIEYLIEGLIPKASTGFIAGESSSLKSFVALDLCLKTTNLRFDDWFDHTIRDHGDAIYCVLEGRAGVPQRLKGWAKHHGLVPGDGLTFVLDGFNLLDEGTPRPPGLIGDQKRFYAMMAREIETKGRDVKLVVIDTASQAMAGANENAAEDMSKLVKVMTSLADAYGCAVFAIHHPPKNGEGLRGSGALKANVDWVLTATRQEGAELPTIVLKSFKTRDGRDDVETTLQALEVDLGFDGRTTLVLDRRIDRPQADGESGDGSAIIQAKTQAGMLRAVDDAWNEGVPMSASPRAKTEGRYVPGVLSRQFKVPIRAAEKLVQTWLDNGVVTTEICNRKTKQKGLRVVVWPPGYGGRE